MAMKSNCPFKNPFVSVVVPVYNTRNYLKKCLDSLLAQSLDALEILVVDDGSDDGSSEIIDAYARNFKNIVPIHKKNEGVASAYNIGIKKARGSYIGFIDSDDWVDKNMFSVLSDKAKETKADVVKSASFYSGRNQKKKVCIPFEKCNRLIKTMTDVPELVIGHPNHWSGIYKKSFLQKNKILMSEYSKEIAPDIEFMFKVFLKAKSLYLVSQPFVHYRTTRPDSDRNSKDKISFYLVNTHALIYDYFKTENVNRIYWNIKVYSEFHHLIFELTNRCDKRRFEFIKKVSELFWNNIDNRYLNEGNFQKKELFLYYIIACFPRLYYLNEKLRFWVTCPIKGERTATYRLFGAFKMTQKNYMTQKKTDKKRYYLFGIRVF